MTQQNPEVYILDANVLIQAHRMYYAFDICPGFWQSLDHHGAGSVQSIDRIKNELLAGNDALAAWARDAAHEEMFKDTTTDDVQTAYRSVIAWAYGSPQFTQSAKDEFARVADGWVIAYAMAKGCVVVTHERNSLTARARILIPNACQAMGVPCLNLYEMLRKLEVSFHWPTPDTDATPPRPALQRSACENLGHF